MHRSLLAREENDNVWCMLAEAGGQGMHKWERPLKREGRECISGNGHCRASQRVCDTCPGVWSLF